MLGLLATKWEDALCSHLGNPAYRFTGKATEVTVVPDNESEVLTTGNNLLDHNPMDQGAQIGLDSAPRL